MNTITSFRMNTNTTNYTNTNINTNRGKKTHPNLFIFREDQGFHSVLSSSSLGLKLLGSLRNLVTRSKHQMGLSSQDLKSPLSDPQ